MPGLKSQKEHEQRKQVLDYATHMPGSRFRAEIWMLRVAKAWPRPCPSAVKASCALDLAFPFRALGFNGGEEESDILDTSGEYALAQPGKPRFERPFENGTVLVDNGAAEASTLQPETAESPGTDVLGAGPSGSGWPGDSHLAAMLNSALVRPLRCLWFASGRHPYRFCWRCPAGQSSSEMPEKHPSSLTNGA